MRRAAAVVRGDWCRAVLASRYFAVGLFIIFSIHEPPAPASARDQI